MLWLGAAGIVVAVVIIGAIVTIAGGSGGSDAGTNASPLTDNTYPVKSFPELGRNHFSPGTIYNNYNRNPPTSGPHASVPAPWGISDTAVPKETAVHNMEHGGVVVWYNCRGGPAPLSDAECASLRAALSQIVQPAVSDGKFVLMTPYAEMTNRIALTAWTYLDAFNDFDATRVTKFIQVFQCRYNQEHFCK
jgi:hypothetical protein